MWDNTNIFQNDTNIQLTTLTGGNTCRYLGPVYTMDHEVGPWKMAFFHDLTSWSNFHGPISWKINLQSLTRCKPDVDQEEWPCTKTWMCGFFFYICPKKVVLKILKSHHSLAFSCLHLLSPKKCIKIIL